MPSEMANNALRCNMLRYLFSITIYLLQRYSTKKFQEPKNANANKCKRLCLATLYDYKPVRFLKNLTDLKPFNNTYETNNFLYSYFREFLFT